MGRKPIRYDQTKFRNRYPRKPWFHPGTVPKPVGIDARVHMLTGFRQVEDGDTEAREFGAIATDHDKVINIDIGGSDVYRTSRNFYN
jgi:hypothetical protein